MRAGNVHASTVEVWGESGPRSAPLQNFFLDRYAAAYKAEMDHFADVIEGKSNPLITYTDGIAALALAEQALASHLGKSVAKL